MNELEYLIYLTSLEQMLKNEALADLVDIKIFEEYYKQVKDKDWFFAKLDLEDEILYKAANTWDDYARRALVSMARGDFPTAAMDSMRAYALNPKNLGIIAMWRFSYIILFFGSWVDQVHRQKLSSTQLMTDILGNILVKKKPNTLDWSWAPEVHKYFISAIASVPIKPRDDFRDKFAWAIDNIEAQVQQIGIIREERLEAIKRHLHAELGTRTSKPTEDERDAVRRLIAERKKSQ